MKKKLITWFATLLLPILCTGCQLMPEEEMYQEPPVLYSHETKEYHQETVVRGDLTMGTTVTCTYMAAKQEQLGFTLGGEYIDQIYVSEGQQVQKGELLAELVYDNLKEEILEMEYECKVLSLQKEHLLENIKLDQQIEEPESVAERYAKQLQEAEDAIYVAELRLDELKKDLQQRQIYAGMDGTAVYVKKIKDGSRSTGGENIITIADIDTNVFLVEGEEAQYFTPGMHTTVKCGKNLYEVDVVEAAELGLAESQKDHALTAYLRLSQPDPTLEDGKKGKIEVILETRSDVLYVPKGAVKTADGKKLVYTLDENGLRVMQNVEIGLKTDEYIEIISGLKEGDPIIIG